MLLNYIKIALRNILRQKSYTFINIGGLAVGLACFILILLYIRYEFSYEEQHEKRDNIYRVNVVHQHPKGEFRIGSSMVPAGKTLTDEVPEIIDFARFLSLGKSLVTYRDKRFYEERLVATDPGIFNIFNIPIVLGDANTALSEKYSVIITESTAKKYFGNENPLGKIIEIDNDWSLTVTGVIKDFPKNTHISYDFLVSFSTLNDEVSESFMNNWVTTRLATYVLVSNGSDISKIEQKINKVYKKNVSGPVEKKLELESFANMHLYSEVTPYGDIQYIYIFLSIGLLILIIAAINFMNLSTARSARRANEVGLRKVVGASHLQLVQQFLGESVLISVIALFFALLISYLFLPVFRELTDQPLQFPGMANWTFYIMLLIISLGVGLLSGSYPAFYLAGFTPGNILRGNRGSKTISANFRRILVVIQFSIAIGLIISTMTISKQLEYVRNFKLGFQKDQMVVIPIMGGELRNNIDPFRQTLLQNSKIFGVTASMLLPSSIGFYNNVTWEGADKNESIALIQNKVDYDFLDTYEIEVVAGRNFKRGFRSDSLRYENPLNAGAIILNQEAVRRFGWKNPIGKKVIQVYGNHRSYLNVIGVVKDFHFSSLHNSIRPLSIFLLPNSPNYISIKIDTKDMSGTIGLIKKTWDEFNPQFPFNYYFLDESFDRVYQSEKNMQTLFNYFSILSIFISCLGLFGLASFTAEQKTKEIGIRKVMGASVTSIVVMLSKEFTKWILIANLIAFPVAWYLMNDWLENFAYHTNAQWWIFLGAGVLALLIALITVSWQAFRAATSNPVDSLKYE